MHERVGKHVFVAEVLGRWLESRAHGFNGVGVGEQDAKGVLVELAHDRKLVLAVECCSSHTDFGVGRMKIRSWQ